MVPNPGDGGGLTAIRVTSSREGCGGGAVSIEKKDKKIVTYRIFKLSEHNHTTTILPNFFGIASCLWGMYMKCKVIEELLLKYPDGNLDIVSSVTDFQ
jgi:hypothetical protein